MTKRKSAAQNICFCLFLQQGKSVQIIHKCLVGEFKSAQTAKQGWINRIGHYRRHINMWISHNSQQVLKWKHRKMTGRTCLGDSRLSVQRGVGRSAVEAGSITLCGLTEKRGTKGQTSDMTHRPNPSWYQTGGKVLTQCASDSPGSRGAQIEQTLETSALNLVG